jgi:hypothetical protein
VLASPATQAAELLRAMRSFLGENDVMAYLSMIAVRLIELHRVLKPTGSLCLHCDPTTIWTNLHAHISGTCPKCPTRLSHWRFRRAMPFRRKGQVDPPSVRAQGSRVRFRRTAIAQCCDGRSRILDLGTAYGGNDDL